ncbi:hypothetical protein VTI74DRAFT_7823 [Chaetomium olivicolor]
MAWYPALMKQICQRVMAELPASSWPSPVLCRALPRIKSFRAGQSSGCAQLLIGRTALHHARPCTGRELHVHIPTQCSAHLPDQKTRPSVSAADTGPGPCPLAVPGQDIHTLQDPKITGQHRSAMPSRLPSPRHGLAAVRVAGERWVLSVFPSSSASDQLEFPTFARSSKSAWAF